METAINLTPSFDSILTKCPLCQSEKIDYYDTDYTGIRIYECSSCSNKFMNPQYSDEYLKSLYSNYIDSEEIKGSDIDLEKAHIDSHQLHFKAIEKEIKPGKVLAFGCGNGKEIQVALNRGWQVEGYDVDPTCIVELRNRYKTTFYSDDFFSLDIPSESYDCIYLDQVLEHLKHPAQYLHQFHRLLKPGGIIFIATPNIVSIASQWKSFIGKLGLKQKYLKHYDTWHHMLYFSPKSLKKLLEENLGFTVLDIENDVFISPNLPNYRYWFLKLATKTPVIWRTTFFTIARKM